MIEITDVLAKLLLGLFAGSLLTEAMILVPYWRKMDPQDFQSLHSDMGPSLYRYFAPLTLAAVAATFLAAAIRWPLPLSWGVATVLVLIAFLTFPLYFKRANASFAKGGLKDDVLRAELRRWWLWHWSRTLMVIAAFGLILL